MRISEAFIFNFQNIPRPEAFDVVCDIRKTYTFEQVYDITQLNNALLLNKDKLIKLYNITKEQINAALREGWIYPGLYYWRCGEHVEAGHVYQAYRLTKKAVRLLYDKGCFFV